MSTGTNLRVLVCGGRDFADRVSLWEVLDQIHQKSIISTLIHGAARGADTLASEWARKRVVSVEPYPADWKRWGSAAGPIRNKQMLEVGRPDVVVAFPGGAGTNDMKQRAYAAGVPVIEVEK